MLKFNSKKLLIIILIEIIAILCVGTTVFAADNAPIIIDSGTTAVTGVILNKTELSLEAGKTETLTATVAPEGATNKNVTWASSDETVATVDTTGKVTAVKAGTATITVTTTDGEKTASCSVTVTSAIITPTPVNNTVSNNVTTYNNTTNTNTNTNRNELGQYGENDIYIVSVLMVVFGVSAIYAYKKIRDYNI